MGSRGPAVVPHPGIGTCASRISLEHTSFGAELHRHASNLAGLPVKPLAPHSVATLRKVKKRKVAEVETDALVPTKTPPPPARATPSLPTLLLYDERLQRHAHPDGRRHAECPERLTHIHAALESTGLLSRCKAVSCGEATDAELRVVHSPFYLQRLAALNNASRERLQAEAEQYDSIFMNEHSVDCAMLAAGGVLSMARKIYHGEARNGMALVRPAGHHADAHSPSGFCLLNSLAVSAKQLLSEGCERVMIVDWDVHHGDGTQKIFIDDPRVLFVSLHRQDHQTFPFDNENAEPYVVGKGAGAGFTVNIAWPEPQMGDAEYLYAFQRVVLPLTRCWKPQMILVSAGFDAAQGDPIGDCCVSPAGFAQMTRSLMPYADGKLLLALEGGYSLQQVGDCVAACVRELLGDAPLEDSATNDAISCCESARVAVNETLRAHAPYWPVLHPES